MSEASQRFGRLRELELLRRDAAKQFSTPAKIPFLPSPTHIVRRMLEIADVRPGEVVYDLGCGDARMLIEAARLFDARGVGIELQQSLVTKARRRVDELELGERIKIMQGNLFQASLKDADVVALYLTRDALTRLRPILEAELKPNARVVTHDFRIRGWKPIYVEKIGDHRIYLYKRPTNMIGKE